MRFVNFAIEKAHLLDAKKQITQKMYQIQGLGHIWPVARSRSQTSHERPP